MAVKAETGDPYIRNVQVWLNKNFGDDSRYNKIEENGKISLATINAMIRGLQIELGISVTADNFGDGTVRAFNKKYPTGVHQQQDNDNAEEKIYGIIQGALLCKGYATGVNTPTLHFYNGTGNAIKKLKQDAGIDSSSSTVTLNVMKALLSMDYFYSYDNSEKTQNIIKMQRYLNKNYEEYIGLRPCDGVCSRRTSKAVIIAIQAEEGLSTTDATGFCGDTTKKCLPVLSTDSNSYGTDCNGKNYSANSLNKFKILAKIALYFNSFGDGSIDSTLSKNDIINFQDSLSIPKNGNIDKTTWLSLIISCGDQSRSAIACDCATIITEENVNVLVKNGYKYIGRYLSGTTDHNEDKGLSRNELQVLFKNGIRVFPIQEGSATYAGYFTVENAHKDAASAVEHADALKLQIGSIIYFAVDFDAMDYQITNLVLPYFEKVHKTVMEEGKAKYRVGIYGTRNACKRVCDAGYACSSFVCDMSTGFSGNLGFKIPDNWALDQFANLKITDGSKTIEIDKDGFSGRYNGISQEYSIADSTCNDKTIHNGSARILINMTDSSVPVYSNKTPINGEYGAVCPAYEPSGEIIGYIKPNDFYIRYQVTKPSSDNVHRVIFNDGIDVKIGYILETFNLPDATLDPTNGDAIDAQILPGHEPFPCVEYDPENKKYILHPFDTTDYREIKINKPVPYFNINGGYIGTLTKGDTIKINRNSYKVAGSSMPWLNRVNGVKKKGETSFNNSVVYVSVGIEYAGSGTERAWY